MARAAATGGSSKLTYPLPSLPFTRVAARRRTARSMVHHLYEQLKTRTTVETHRTTSIPVHELATPQKNR